MIRGLLLVAALAVCTLEAADPPAAGVDRSISSTAGGVIPYFADGEGWSTLFSITCLTQAGCPFSFTYLGSNGQRVPIAMRVTPPSEVQTNLNQAALNLSIGFGGTILIETLGQSAPLVTGGVDVVSTATMAGFSTFRSRVAGRPDFEATVVMESRLFQNSFIVNFDNRDGFATGVALTNLSSSLRGDVTITGIDLANRTLFTRLIQIDAVNGKTFNVGVEFPETAGKVGRLLFSSTTAITGTGFRFNPSGSFTTLPIFQIP